MTTKGSCPTCGEWFEFCACTRPAPAADGVLFRGRTADDAYADGQAEGERWERAAIVRWLDKKGYNVTAQRIARGEHIDGADDA